MYVLTYSPLSYLAIAFDKQTSGQRTNYQYQIWYNFTSNTNISIFPDSSPLQGTSRDTRLDDPFGTPLLSIMRGIDEAILATADGSAPDIEVRLKNFPDMGRSVYVANKDSIWFFGGVLLFLPIMLLFVTTLINIVREKSLRLRESMEIMGMSNSAYWISLFVGSALVVGIQTLVLCLLGMAFQFTFFLNSNFVASRCYILLTYLH
jgi:hypothetical protein